MNRRTALNIIFVGIIGSTLTFSYGKKKSKKNKRKNVPSKKQIKTQKISGEIILSNENMTKTYKLVGAKSYCISKAVEGKVSSYVGEKITVYGKVVNEKIITIEAVTSSSAPKNTPKVN